MIPKSRPIRQTPTRPRLDIERVLITGVAGFVGYHLAQRLLRDGDDVFGVDNLDPYYDIDLKRARLARLRANPRLRFQEMDIADSAAFLELCQEFRPTTVVNLAARAGVRNPSGNLLLYAHPNLTGFASVLDACRQVRPRHLVYASSSSVYGVGCKAPFREDEPIDNPASFYAATKRSNELMAQALSSLEGIACTGLRFFTLYGPWGRPDMAYYSFARAIAAGEPIVLHDAATMRRDFTYIDDAVEAVGRLLRLGAACEAPPRASLHRVYNIGNAHPVTVETFASTLQQLLGRRAEVRHRAMQPGEVPLTFADTSRLKADTGYAPDTPLADGLARFVAWFRDYHATS